MPKDRDPNWTFSSEFTRSGKSYDPDRIPQTPEDRLREAEGASDAEGAGVVGAEMRHPWDYPPHPPPHRTLNILATNAILRSAGVPEAKIGQAIEKIEAAIEDYKRWRPNHPGRVELSAGSGPPPGKVVWAPEGAYEPGATERAVERELAKPTIGRIVHYRLSADDAQYINARRAHAQAHLDHHRETKNGAQIHVGSQVGGGDLVAMVVTSVPKNFGRLIDGKCLLNGSDDYWVTNVSHGNNTSQWCWPERV